MTQTQYLYLAGTGMVTPIGGCVATTHAAITCSISAYQETEHFCHQGYPLTLASVPNQLLNALEVELDEGNSYNWRHERVTKMAIFAARHACQGLKDGPIPIILGLAELPEDPTLAPMLNNLANNCGPWLSAHLSRCLPTGRASGMDAIAFTFNHVAATYPYCLVGGSDSFQDMAILTPLMEQGRLHNAHNNNGFAPGEGACFLLLTPHRERATVRNGHIIGLRPPGISEEPGHLGSPHPYRGEGLAQAFKLALQQQAPQSISRIYGSLNGENYWAKELGVAQVRSQAAFKPDVYMRTTAERDRIINRGHPDILEQDKANLIAQGWYKEHEIKVNIILHGTPGVRGQPPTPPLAELVVNRSGIRSAYSNIPLKIMAEFGQKHGVNFLPELTKIADRILQGEEDLLTLEKKIRTYINPARGKATDPQSRSKPEDWLRDESIKPIRHRHFNFSSKVGAGYSPRIVNGIRTRYIVNA